MEEPGAWAVADVGVRARPADRHPDRVPDRAALLRRAPPAAGQRPKPRPRLFGFYLFNGREGRRGGGIATHPLPHGAPGRRRLSVRIALRSRTTAPQWISRSG